MAGKDDPCPKACVMQVDSMTTKELTGLLFRINVGGPVGGFILKGVAFAILGRLTALEAKHEELMNALKTGTLN